MALVLRVIKFLLTTFFLILCVLIIVYLPIPVKIMMFLVFILGSGYAINILKKRLTPVKVMTSLKWTLLIFSFSLLDVIITFMLIYKDNHFLSLEQNFFIAAFYPLFGNFAILPVLLVNFLLILTVVFIVILSNNKKTMINGVFFFCIAIFIFAIISNLFVCCHQ